MKINVQRGGFGKVKLGINTETKEQNVSFLSFKYNKNSLIASYKSILTSIGYQNR